MVWVGRGVTVSIRKTAQAYLLYFRVIKVCLVPSNGGAKVFYVSPNTRGQRFIAIGQADDTSEWMSWPILASLDSVHWEKKFSSGSSADGVITWKSFVPVTLPLYRSPVWLTAKAVIHSDRIAELLKTEASVMQRNAASKCLGGEKNHLFVSDVAVTWSEEGKSLETKTG